MIFGTPGTVGRPLGALSATLFALLLSDCGGGGTETSQATEDDTDAVQSAVDRGGVVTFDARTYYLSRTIVISHSNTTIQGAGSQTVFQYRASSKGEHCVNDRVFTTPCGIDDNPPRRVANAIAVGDDSFAAAAVADVSDLQSGDWLLISDIDSVIGDRVTADWAQVKSVSGLVVYVRTPFRTAFTNARTWDPAHSGLGFQRIDPLVENVAFRDFVISVPDAGPSINTAGISVFNALHTTIDHVVVEDFDGQPFYSRFSKDLTITNSVGRGHTVLNEFATTVDLTLNGNHFNTQGTGFGLDLGTAFFSVADNYVDTSSNSGAYLLYGVHDGTVINNQIGEVASSVTGGSADGMLIWGSQNITVSDNYLAGGAGPNSTGISVRSLVGEIPMPAVNVLLIDNSFGSGWVMDYEAGTQPTN